MRTFAVDTAADPERAWRLLARPGDWQRWSPHVRGAWHLGTPEVREGAAPRHADLKPGNALPMQPGRRLAAPRP